MQQDRDTLWSLCTVPVVTSVVAIVIILLAVILATYL